METTFDYNKVLKKVAKERLTPYGIIQQGKSRTFLYDNNWWTIVIEFQGSSFSKGTYLNIGIDFNFYPRNYFSFSYGYREKGFEIANDENQFANIINDYCDFTIAKVDDLKLKFKDAQAATNTFKKQVENNPWDNFTLAILYGLTENINECRNYLFKVQEIKCEYEYEFKRQKLVTEILTWLDNNQTFLTKMKDLINQTRELKKLPISV